MISLFVTYSCQSNSQIAATIYDVFDPGIYLCCRWAYLMRPSAPSEMESSDDKDLSSTSVIYTDTPALNSLRPQLILGKGYINLTPPS